MSPANAAAIERLPLYTLLLAAGLLWLVWQTGLDHWLAGQIYSSETGWAWRHHFITSTLMHRVGKPLSILAWLVLCFFWIRVRRAPAPVRRDFLLMLIAMPATGILAWGLKHWFEADCPWDLIEFGGERPFAPWWDYPLAMRPSMHCFPAGHASAGYAWFSAYFFLRRHRPEWARAAFFTALALGLFFGIGQQLRGAHFISHDLVTLMMCLACNALLFACLGSPAQSTRR